MRVLIFFCVTNFILCSKIFMIIMKTVFYSTLTDFRVILKNVNYNIERMKQIEGQVTIQELLSFCMTPRSRKEMQEFCRLSSRNHFSEKYLNLLLKSGKLKMTIPDKPNSRLQKYISS